GTDPRKLAKIKIVKGTCVTEYTNARANKLSIRFKFLNKKNNGIQASTIGIIIEAKYILNNILLPRKRILTIAYAVGNAKNKHNNAPSAVTKRLLKKLVPILYSVHALAKLENCHV